MKQIIRFVTWPVLAGLLAAALVLQQSGALRRGPADAPAESLSSGFSAAVRAAVPSVVNIYSNKRIPARRPRRLDDPYTRRLLDSGNFRRERIQRSLGSGVIVSAQGLVLTSRHVISDADEILVLLNDGRSGLAQVIGSDRDTDLAVLQIQLDNIRAISLADPDAARVGDIVLAIGNPYGFGHSVSQGIISALGRHGLNLSTYEDFIQTDAAINQGNSGGALIDTGGRLLGINTAIFSRSGEYTGIGLATPVDLVMDVSRDVINYGKVIRGWMGLEAQALSTPGRTGQALLVTGLHPRGPAARAGIRQGDAITHIDRQPVVNGRATMRRIASLRPGTAVSVSLQRNGEEIIVQVVVGERPVRAN